MKITVWIVTAMLVLLWSGGAFIAAALTDWAGQVLAAGGGADWARAASEWPVPAWIGLWIDPAAVEAAQAALQWSMGAFGDVLPHAGTAVGWLVPLIWVLWAVGVGLLLVLAGAAHWLIGRRPASTPRPTGLMGTGG